MRKKIIPLLRDPNNRTVKFKVFGISVSRNNQNITNLVDSEIQNEDDILEGVLIAEEGRTAYPINGAVAILLNDLDVDTNHHCSLLESMLPALPSPYKEITAETLTRLQKTADTFDGKWNREEMKYYDKEVSSDDQRNKMLQELKNKPIWRIFLPRKKYIIDLISNHIKNKFMLEIGSGNSRTISYNFDPGKNSYNYIGTDISFKRLLVAKQAIPTGDFIQTSALNLPFKPESFEAIISFGMLHHLPRPSDAVKECHNLIIPGGYFAFHEPINRPTLNVPGMESLKKAMTTYEHSEHDGKIDLAEITKLMAEINFHPVSVKYQISALRTMIETLIKNISRKIMLQKFVINMLSATDEIVLSTLGKMSAKYGPSAVLAVFKKK